MRKAALKGRTRRVWKFKSGVKISVTHSDVWEYHMAVYRYPDGEQFIGSSEDTPLLAVKALRKELARDVIQRLKEARNGKKHKDT